METAKDDGDIYLIPTLLWIAQQLFVTLAIYLLTGRPLVIISNRHQELLD
jgi:hypothetical protein